MTKHAVHTATQRPPHIPESGLGFWNGDDSSLSAATSAYNAWLANVERVHDESVRFLRERISTGLQAITDFSTCKSPTEVLDLQIEYTGNALSAFMEEGKKMAELCSRLAEPADTK